MGVIRDWLKRVFSLDERRTFLSAFLARAEVEEWAFGKRLSHFDNLMEAMHMWNERHGNLARFSASDGLSESLRKINYFYDKEHA